MEDWKPLRGRDGRGAAGEDWRCALVARVAKDDALLHAPSTRQSNVSTDPVQRKEISRWRAARLFVEGEGKRWSARADGACREPRAHLQPPHPQSAVDGENMAPDAARVTFRARCPSSFVWSVGGIGWASAVGAVLTATSQRNERAGRTLVRLDSSVRLGSAADVGRGLLRCGAVRSCFGMAWPPCRTAKVVPGTRGLSVVRRRSRSADRQAARHGQRCTRARTLDQQAHPVS